jgi:hypothetical protein
MDLTPGFFRAVPQRHIALLHPPVLRFFIPLGIFSTVTAGIVFAGLSPGHTGRQDQPAAYSERTGHAPDMTVPSRRAGKPDR